VQIIENIAKTPMLLQDDLIPSEEPSVIPSEDEESKEMEE
jgi:hypothetical protein